MKRLKLRGKFILSIGLTGLLVVGSLVFSILKFTAIKNDFAGIDATLDDRLQSAILLMFILFAVTILVAVVLNIAVSTKVVKGITQLSNAAGKLAVGDIDIQLNTTGSDEIAELSSAFLKIAEGTKQQIIVTEMIVAGNMDVEIPIRSDNDVLNIKLQQMSETIGAILSEVDVLVDDITIGQLGKRTDVTSYEGGWRDFVLNVNRLMDTITGFFDKMPILMMFADKDYKVTYMNKTATDILRETKDSVIDKKCYNLFCTDHCQSDNCACSRAMAQEKMVNDETVAHLGVGNVDINYSGLPLYNTKGEIQGFFEVVLDQTAIKTAERKATKLTNYQNNEVEKLKVELENLAQGMLDMKAKTEPSDDDTNEIAGVFNIIYGSLDESIGSIKSYINEMSDILSEMSDGNLQKTIAREYKGDFTQIKDAINMIVDSLNRVLGDISDASEQVSLGSKQVADSAQALSRGASDQASSVEEITSAMTEIAEQTTQNADNAGKANSISLVAKEDAIRGNQQMQETLAAMTAINNSSANISKIIKVIDEIAFQTNILALNAAVEAARAGEHGNGFAVVAEEVRNLAARSANAAKEPTGLIESSIQKAQDGTAIANDTAEALNKIVSGVTESAVIVDDIAKASREQAIAIHQINEGIEQISRVTQMNTATAEESASASEELLSQSELTQEMVSQFDLKRAVERKVSTYNNLKKKARRTPIRLEDEDMSDDFINLDSKEFGKF
ncbi:MAG: methyl-accepting chemotaxis protein [Vallitaleaceae bacterium]|jgi:methyl-accepting chemotaxis protein|nr:methyl-accepting chemotaxis protein [Vallitaleaceae bacterium]